MSGFRPPTVEDIPSVREMVAAMDRTVAGLEDFKRRLAVVLRDHMLAAVHERPWHPGNVLIVGPTGVGKTYTLRRLLEAIPVIWCEASATEFSDTGYHGRDLPTMYLGLTHQHWREVVDAERGRRIGAREHQARAERWGVVLLDEFDKLRTNKTAVPGERQVGKVLQFELLKLVEGTEILVPTNERGDGFLFQTNHVLHIAMGAFEGINTTIAEFEHVPFSEELYRRATPEDFIEHGFIAELMGRFATILTLPPVKTDQLVRIVREQLAPVLVAQLADEGITLLFDEGAMYTVANMAMQRAIGARALEPIVKDMLWRARHDARPGDTLVLDAVAAGQQNARLERREAA